MTPEERVDAVIAAAEQTTFPAVFEIEGKTIHIQRVWKQNDRCVGFVAYVEVGGVFQDVDQIRYVVNPPTQVAEGAEEARILREAPIECLAMSLI